MSAPAPRSTIVTRTFPIIFAAPSGAGKTTLARELGVRRSDVEFSVSCTTRTPRGNERDGVDYHFKTADEFRALIAAGEMLEWAQVHGQLYGTPRANLEAAQANRHFLLLDIDVQGSRQVKQALPEAVSIFVLPPTGHELARRLVGRGSETPEVRRRRLLAARGELTAASEYDYVLINDDVTASVDAVERIIAAEAHRTYRLPELPEFVNSLIHEIDGLLDA